MSIRERCEDWKPHPLIDRIMLWLSAAGRPVDGLWIGSYYQENAEQAFRRVEEALCLIKTYDRPKYDRLRCDLDRIWVRPLMSGGCAQFNPVLRACLLDERFVDDTKDAEFVAAAIVHEATHARLWNRGIRYDEAVRQRVEGICMRRELALARKLPDGHRLRQWAEDTLAMPASYWSDEAARDRSLRGRIEALQHLERNWVARIVLALLKRRLRRTGHKVLPQEKAPHG